jgi:ribosomal protein L37AE/L43A
MTNNKEVNPGWKHEDQHYLSKEADPELQVFSEEDWEDVEPEQQHYFCALCKSRLDFLKETGTMWRCNECMEYYNTSIQDVPVKDLRESKVKTYTELSHYPTYEEDDMFTPFIEGINPDREEDYDQEGVELVSPSYDNRMQHIRVKGDITKALSAQHNFE